MPIPVSETLMDKSFLFEGNVSHMPMLTSMFPLSVYLRELESRFDIIFSIFSASKSIGKVLMKEVNVRLMDLSAAKDEKDWQILRINGIISPFLKFKVILL